MVAPAVTVGDILRAFCQQYSHTNLTAVTCPYLSVPSTPSPGQEVCRRMWEILCRNFKSLTTLCPGLLVDGWMAAVLCCADTCDPKLLYVLPVATSVVTSD